MYFLLKTINFQGFEVSSGSSVLVLKSVTAIRNFPVPQSDHNAHQFIGFIGFFRHFVKGYATIARPLSNLLKEDITWKWTEEKMQAPSNVSKKPSARVQFCSYSVQKLRLRCYTDLSKFGLSRILLQRHDNRFHLIAYFHRQTCDAENNYH